MPVNMWIWRVSGGKKHIPGKHYDIRDIQLTVNDKCWDGNEYQIIYLVLFLFFVVAKVRFRQAHFREGIMSWVGDETELLSLGAGSPPSSPPPPSFLPLPPTSGAYTPLASCFFTSYFPSSCSLSCSSSFFCFLLFLFLLLLVFHLLLLLFLLLSFYFSSSSDLLLCLSFPQAIQTATYQCPTPSEKVHI